MHYAVPVHWKGKSRGGPEAPGKRYTLYLSPGRGLQRIRVGNILKGYMLTMNRKQVALCSKCHPSGGGGLPR